MICNNCGATFDEQDMAHYREDYGEVFAACPVCGQSDIAESDSCQICLEEKHHDDLREGICLQCLWDSIDYETALAYMIDMDSLADFLFSEWCEAEVTVKHMSNALSAMLSSMFRRLALIEEESVNITGCRNFLKACRYHCLPYYPEDFGIDGGSFAEWLAEHRKEGVKVAERQ